MPPDDLGRAVELANAIGRGSGRRVDWIHLPVLTAATTPSSRRSRTSSRKGARVYLGVIHNMDGSRSASRLRASYLPDFGVGGYCGFGRVPPAELPGVLKEHQQAIAAAG